MRMRNFLSRVATPGEDEILTTAVLRKELQEFMDGTLELALRQLEARLLREVGSTAPRVRASFKESLRRGPVSEQGGSCRKLDSLQLRTSQLQSSFGKEAHTRASTIAFADEVDDDCDRDDDPYLNRFMKRHQTKDRDQESMGPAFTKMSSIPKRGSANEESKRRRSILTAASSDMASWAVASVANSYKAGTSWSSGFDVEQERPGEDCTKVGGVEQTDLSNETTTDTRAQGSQLSERHGLLTHHAHRSDDFTSAFFGDEPSLWEAITLHEEAISLFTEETDFSKEHKSICQDRVQEIVDKSWFEHTIGIVVLVNAILLGFETDCMATNRNSTWRQYFRVIDGCFCVLFTLELALRLFAHRCAFFTMSNWRWNVFDLLVVCMQVADQVTHICLATGMPMSPSVLRSIRVLRISRITRLVRVARSFEELSSIMSSIASSLVALFWTLLLLLMTIYANSVFYTQVVLEATDARHLEALNHWYGSIFRTMLTMFEVIAGGVSWDECIWPLIVDVHPIMGLGFVIYIAFCVFAMMNMATGVFVERATRKASEDQDAFTAKHISDLFFNDPELDHSEVTWEFFERKMDTPDMQEYFKMINVDPSEARGLFQLLDADDSGSVDAEELVNGCLRLRGGAKALELSLLMHQSTRMYKKMKRFQNKAERRLEYLCRQTQLSQPSGDSVFKSQPEYVSRIATGGGASMISHSAEPLEYDMNFED